MRVRAKSITLFYLQIALTVAFFFAAVELGWVFLLGFPALGAFLQYGLLRAAPKEERVRANKACALVTVLLGTTLIAAGYIGLSVVTGWDAFAWLLPVLLGGYMLGCLVVYEIVFVFIYSRATIRQYNTIQDAKMPSKEDA